MPATPCDGHQKVASGELKAGHNDGDVAQQLTNEERMLEEIAQQKEQLDAMPGDSYSDFCAKAPHANKLGQLEFKHQMLVEKKRLAHAMSKFVEEHGDLYSEPCLICLDDVHVHASMALVELLFCCGGFICKTCARNIELSELGMVKCPLCREPIGSTNEAEAAAKLTALAERGVVWAQADVGTRMVHGIGGFKKQETSGLEWLNKAAAQQYPRAIYYLSNLYRTGLTSVLRKSQEKANEMLLKSANLGCAPANSALAGSHFRGLNGFENDADEAYFRASVAYAINDSDKKAGTLLGLFHRDGDV